MRPFRAATALVLAAACAEVKPPLVEQRAPTAARPTLLGIYHSKLRPTRASGTLVAGEVKELRACLFDTRVAELPPGGGLLLRVESPVPLDLRMQVDTSQGQRVVGAPEDADDEERLFRRGQGYFYENAEITRGVPTGKIAPRELAIWPGVAAAEDRRVDLSLATISFDPRATGADLQSPPLLLSLVGRCPDFALSLSRDAVTLQQGQARRIFVQLKPIGDGVRTMKTTLALEGLPKGVKAELKEPVATAADWTSVRETSFDLEVAADAPPGTAKLTLKGALGAVERKASLALTVQPKSE